MKIILKENNLYLLLNRAINEIHNPYTNKIDSALKSLNNLIMNSGSIMYNIENGKDYIVYYDESVSNTIGKNYCLSKLMKDGKPYGQISIKPMDTFKIKN